MTWARQILLVVLVVAAPVASIPAASAGAAKEAACPGARALASGQGGEVCRVAEDVDEGTDDVQSAAGRSPSETVEAGETTARKLGDDVENWTDCESIEYPVVGGSAPLPCQADAGLYGNASCRSQAWGDPCVAASVAGEAACHAEATRWSGEGSCLAVSGTGDATCAAERRDSYPAPVCLALSGTGDATCEEICAAASADGRADCGEKAVLPGLQAGLDCAAVSLQPWIDAATDDVAVGSGSASGDVVAASLFGSAYCSAGRIDILARRSPACAAVAVEGSAACYGYTSICVSVLGAEADALCWDVCVAVAPTGRAEASCFDPHPGHNSCVTVLAGDSTVYYANHGSAIRVEDDRACADRCARWGYDSDEQCRESDCVAVSVFGEAGGGAVGLSGTDDADGELVAASLYGRSDCWAEPSVTTPTCVAVSGTRAAESCSGWTCVAASGTGPARSQGTAVSGSEHADGGLAGVAVLGGAGGRWAALSATGDVDADNGAAATGTGTARSCYDPGDLVINVVCIALSGTGDATGDAAAVTGTGDARSDWVAASVTGDACSGHPGRSDCYESAFVAASATGDAEGCIAVSGTGRAGGECGLPFLVPAAFSGCGTGEEIGTDAICHDV